MYATIVLMQQQVTWNGRGILHTVRYLKINTDFSGNINFKTDYEKFISLFLIVCTTLSLVAQTTNCVLPAKIEIICMFADKCRLSIIRKVDGTIFYPDTVLILYGTGITTLMRH